MLEKSIFIIEGLNVIESNMKRNMMKYGGIIFSQRVLLELIKKGMKREDAYSLVQKAALEAWNNEGDFKENLLKDKKIQSLLTRDELEELFDVKYHLRYIDKIIGRLENI
jgi:adenylosuccinate lyase